MEVFKGTFSYKLIYVFEINDENHKGLLKIGDATLNTDETVDKLFPNCKELNKAAKERIDSYTNTAGVRYNLLHTEIAIKSEKDDNGKTKTVFFRDTDVHDLLENSGYIKYKIVGTTAREWFKIDLDIAVKAIDCYKKGYKNLSHSNAVAKRKISFRPEQEDAIDKTLRRFKTGNKMLWNAKMRFGKTLCALEVAKRSKFKKSIIITHRPVVDNGWYEDFNKIFNEEDGYIYGSKNHGYTVKELEKLDKSYIYFASIQDLRGSGVVGGKYDKNNEIFNINWDFVIVDEAHEGTTTALGDEVIKQLVKEENGIDTKFLALSGTPFNIVNEYDSDSVFTWDYIMEQNAKHVWDRQHFGDHNPYEELPEMKILTYDLGKIINNKKYLEVSDKAFNFREFFRTWTGDIKIDGAKMPINSKGKFIHEEDVKKFIKLISKESDDSNYPFSKKEYRDMFRHTLWVVPGVKEAKALSVLLKNDNVFGMGFEIVNVAGEGDDDVKQEEALKMVRDAINRAGDNGYTITLSCGKLTTGVTVKEWNAVMMLAGSYSTSAANYLQTIFRVQSPCNKNGKMKTSAYVFDFAPDRTLKMVASSVAISTKAGGTSDNDRTILGKFLNFCPVISIDGTEMKNYDTNRLLQQLKRAYAERVVQNGFDDSTIYNDDLLKLTDIELKEFENLKGIIGSTASSYKTNEIDINRQGLTEEERERIQEIEKKKRNERTPEEQAELDKANEAKKTRRDAISILRGLSIRMPLLIYGADVPLTEDITIEQLADLVDDLSWNEFMPNGVSKDEFKKFIKYYDPEIFIAAGRRIRNITKGADELEPLERVKEIANLFSCFKNPDKETVLTPWRVVNMHMADCLGGYKFFDFENKEQIEIPEFIDHGTITCGTITNKEAKILEINSKTGLYPLYITYSIFKTKCNDYNEDELTLDFQQKLWFDTVKNNIYVICKTPMAKSITKRTLIGFKDQEKINTHYFEDLTNMLKNKPDQFINKVLKPSYWGLGGNDNMKFDAVVGNPPYQQQDSGTNDLGGVSRTSATSVYQLFTTYSKKISNNYVSLIIPSRWMTGGKGLDSFRQENLNDKSFLVIHDYENDQEIFPNTDIGGGVMYFLWSKTHNGKVNYYTHKNDETYQVTRDLNTGDSIIIRDYNSATIIKKIKKSESFMNIVSSRNPFGFGADITRKKTDYFNDNFSSKYNVKFYAWDGTPIIKYANEKIFGDTIKLVKSYKVFISKTADPPVRFGRENKDILRKPFFGDKYTACSETYLTIGSFDSEEPVNNIIKYIKTKFFRFLVLQKKKTQNVSKSVFEFVPIQDFTNNSDINWNDSIKGIDEQLYKKYDLSSSDIKYIESKINSME